MKFPVILIVLISIFLTGCEDSRYSDIISAINNDPETTLQLKFDDSKVSSYKKLAAQLGFNYDQEYYWIPFNELLKSKGLGLAGAYEFFPGSSNDWFVSPNATTGWEFVYYKNVDMSVIYEVRRDNDRTHSYARLLKLAHGRVPDLYKL